MVVVGRSSLFAPPSSLDWHLYIKDVINPAPCVYLIYYGIWRLSSCIISEGGTSRERLLSRVQYELAAMLLFDSRAFYKGYRLVLGLAGPLNCTQAGWFCSDKHLFQVTDDFLLSSALTSSQTYISFAFILRYFNDANTKRLDASQRCFSLPAV